MITEKIKFVFVFVLWGLVFPMSAQRVLTLDSCRSLALRNNKQMKISQLELDVALNTRKAARTKYLPKIDALGGYELFSKEVSILNNRQKSALTHLGTNTVNGIGMDMESQLGNMVSQGLISAESAQHIGNMFQQMSSPIAQAGNQMGQTIREAFRTNTRNIWSGAVMLRQPVYMGGAISAANRMADIAEDLAANKENSVLQNTLYDIDQTYWTVVSLKSKRQLAYSYRDLVKNLDDDIHKMIREGVATRADGLKVDVRVNEADMQVTQVEDGLTLAKMLLCQLCGLPLNEEIILTDENENSLAVGEGEEFHVIGTGNALQNRPELKMLQNAIDMSKQATRLIRAEYLPHIALTGGYLISNPNVFNGFERKFSGVWNVGVLVQVPLWNWFEGSYKIRASKAATSIATMELNDASEKIELQISQSRFKLDEAGKRLAMARKNVSSAEENLRCANIGFQEGVMETTDVMAAQTAWQQAQSQKIDAEIDVKLAQVGLQKALGVLQ